MDLINRQAAIDALADAGLINYAATGNGNGMIQAITVIKNMPSAEPEPIKLHALTEEEIKNLKQKIADSPIAFMPSAERKGKWIPCSERLPEEEGHYLLSLSDGFVASADYYNGDWELWEDCGEPLAWQYLPEPYKEGDAE